VSTNAKPHAGHGDLASLGVKHSESNRHAHNCAVCQARRFESLGSMFCA
jgi:hypothetical protein